MTMYCIYLRKSRADAELEKLGQGETLARHRRTLTELAERQGYEIGTVYEEIVSGETLAARPQMQQLLSDVEAGTWKGVLVMELERLARGNSIDQGIVIQAFQITGTLIITPNKVYDPKQEFDEEYLEFGLFMSRREYKTINRRLQAGRIAAVKEGNFIGSAPPFGYTKTRLEHGKGFSLAIKEDEAQYVRMIFKWFVNDGLTPIMIADRLTDMGVKSHCGSEYFSQYTVRYILQNRHYIGETVWNRREQKKVVSDGAVKITRPTNPLDKQIISAGKHEPIISAALFEAAQERVGRCARKRQGVPLRNPFAGVCFCRECGRSMIYRPNNKSGDLIICPNKYCDVSCFPFTTFEESVLKLLTEEVGRLEVEDDNPDVISTEKQHLNGLISELEKVKKQQSSLYDLLEQGIYTKNVFLERQTALKERYEKLSAEISAIKSKKTPKDVERTIGTVHKLLSTWDTISAEEKNLLLKQCVRKIVYFRAHSDRYHQQPVEISVELKF